MQPLHADEGDGDVEEPRDDCHRHVVEAIGRTDQRAGDAGLHGVPAEQQRGEQARGEDIALPAEYAGGDEREVLARARADEAEEAYVDEHDDIADHHGLERVHEAHAEHQDRARHRAGDDHREPDPHHHVRE
jgi:hypothetical protein